VISKVKTILIFGAGINQLELIREARKLDVITIAIDPSPEPLGKTEADFFYQVEGNDYDITREIALKHHVNGIVTGQMEKPMRLMSKLANELGYLFHKPDVVEKTLDKWLMKHAFQKYGVPCAKGKLIGFSDVLTPDTLNGFTYPLIIKPKDAFSSRGVFKIDNYKKIADYISETRSFSSNGDVLIEEFIDGKEFSIESITFKGKTTIVQITEKFITPFPNTVEMGHLQPAFLTEEQRNQISEIVIDAIAAIGIDNSASHAEVILTSDGPRIIEIGARLGGDFISSYLTKASTGISMDKAAVQIALGIEPDLQKKQDRYAYIKYVELAVGEKVNRVENISDLYVLPGLVLAQIFVKPGDVIKPITHSAFRPACVIVSGESRREVYGLADKYENIIRNHIIFFKKK
jgi:biotin carboxylase